MTTINLNDPYVHTYTMTVAEARELLDGDMQDDLGTVLDAAQGCVGAKETAKSWLVIEIIPDGDATDPAA